MKKESIFFLLAIIVFILSLISAALNAFCGTSARDVSCDCCAECECKSCSNATSPTESTTIPSTEEDNRTTVSRPSSTNELDKDTTPIMEEEEKPTDPSYEEVLYDKAKEMYLSSEWDGTPLVLEGHTISLSETTGIILVDSHQVTCFPEPIDFIEDPLYEMFNSNYEYIPGHGVYVIKDKTLVKYVRGEMITLEGGAIDWEGLDPKNPYETGYVIKDSSRLYSIGETNKENWYYLFFYDPYLYYVPEADQLLFVTSDPAKGIYYLYLFPDYDVSEVKLLTTLSDYAVIGATGIPSTFYYTDTDGVSWKYGKNGPEVYPHNYG